MRTCPARCVKRSVYFDLVVCHNGRTITQPRGQPADSPAAFPAGSRTPVPRRCQRAGPSCRDLFAERDVTEYLAGSRGSLRLDACELDHLAPLLGLFSDELCEVGG